MYNTSDSVPRAGEGKALGNLTRKVRAHILAKRKLFGLSARLDSLIQFREPEEMHRTYAPFSKYVTSPAGREITKATMKGKPRPLFQAGQRKEPFETMKAGATEATFRPGADPFAQAGGTKPRGAKGTQVKSFLNIIRDPASGELHYVAPGQPPIKLPKGGEVVGRKYLYHKERWRPRALLKAKQNIAWSQERPKFATLPKAERDVEEQRVRTKVAAQYFPEAFDVKAGGFKEWKNFGIAARRTAREKLIKETIAHRNIRAGELRMARAIIHGRGVPLAAARAEPETITRYVERLKDIVGKRQEQAHESLSTIEKHLQGMAERGVPVVNPAISPHTMPEEISRRAREVVDPLSGTGKGTSTWTGAPIGEWQGAEIGRHLTAGAKHVRIPITAERVQHLQKSLNALRDIATAPGEPKLREQIVRSGELFRNLPTAPPAIKGYPYLRKTAIGAGLLAGGLYAAKKIRDVRNRNRNINFAVKPLSERLLRIAREAAEEQAARAAKTGGTPVIRTTPEMIYRTMRAPKIPKPTAAAGPTSTGSQVFDYLAQQRLTKQKIVAPSQVPVTPEGFAKGGISLYPKGAPPRTWPLAIRLRRVINWYRDKQFGRAYQRLAKHPELPTNPNALTYAEVARERSNAVKGLTEQLAETEARLGRMHTEERQAGFRIGQTLKERELTAAHKQNLEKQRVALTSEQSRRLNRATGIAVGTTAAAGVGGYLLGRHRPTQERQFAKKDEEDVGESGIGHDVITGAVEGGLAYPASEWAYKKLIGKGTPSTAKKILAGGVVGGLATGLVGISVANILRAQRKAREKALSQQQMKSRLRLIQFQRRNQQPGAQRTLVAKSRYLQQVREKDYDRANRHYVQSALLGGALGLAFRKRPTSISKAIITGAGLTAGTQAAIRAYGAQHEGPFGERSWTQKRAEKTVPVVASGILAGKLIGKERLLNLFRYSSRIRPIRFAAADTDGYDPNDPLTKWSKKWIYKKNWASPANVQKVRKWVGRGSRGVRDIGEAQAGIVPRDTRGRPRKREWEKPWVTALGTVLALKGGLWGANKLRQAIVAAPVESRLGQFREGFVRGGVRKIPVIGPIAEHITGMKEDLKRLIYKKAETPKFTGTVNPKTGNPLSPNEMARNEAKAAEAKYWSDVASGKVKPEEFRKPNKPSHEYRSRLREIRFAQTVPYWDIRDERGKSARVYAPGSQRRAREEMSPWKKKKTQRHILQAALAATGVVGGVGALVYGKRAFKIGREFERAAGRTVGSTGKEISESEALRRIPGTGLAVVTMPESLKKPHEPPFHWQARHRLIRFDSQDRAGLIAAGAGGAGFVTGGLYRGRRIVPGEDLTGRRVIRSHSMFPFMQHEGVGIGPSQVVDVFHKPGMKKHGIVRSVPLEEFSGGRPVSVMGWANPLAPIRAKARIGEKTPYTLLRRNCQLFGDECRDAAFLTRKFIPRQVRTALTVGGASAAGAYGLTKIAGRRKHEFATKDDERIDWEDLRQKALVVGQHGAKWGGATAAVGGTAAAALGAPFIPGAVSFLKIPGRRLARKAQTGVSKLPLLRSLIKPPKYDPLVYGKSVHDYIQGSQRILNTGIHGRLVGQALQSAIAHPTGFAGRQLRGRFGMDEWGLKHWARFRSGHLPALYHWDREYKDLITRRSVPHREGAGWGKMLPGTPPAAYAKQVKRYREGRRATFKEYRDLTEEKGLSHAEAFRHITTKSTDPRIRTYMKALVSEKQQPMEHYARLAAISPALVGGGGATAVGGYAAYKRANDER